MAAQFKTEYGDDISPRDTLYSLNIFINIVYDLCPECDPFPPGKTPNWLPGAANTINVNPPAYLEDFMDWEFHPENIRGSFTKFYADASFNNFIVLGDFVVVNIAQSMINPDPPYYFGETKLLDSTVAMINQQGGLSALYGHDSADYYDGHINTGVSFKQKTGSFPDQKLDLVQFFIRNSAKQFGNLVAGGRGHALVYDSLLIGGILYDFGMTTYIGAVGNQDLSHPGRFPTEIHELSHHLLGMGNYAHMGGGGPVNRGDLVTLEHNSGGWSMIGSSTSSLISCNAYERWRLNWRGPTNQDYRIACQNENSDLQKSDGPKTFLLRDFISTGDAVRIRLPYLDENAIVQYIWLENHRIHENDRIDYPAYWERSCKDDGIPGVFAYYQVGKDSLVCSTYTSQLHGDTTIRKMTDHLVPISAEGNWDIRLLTDSATACVNGQKQPIQEYYQENPFSGYNDLENHYFNSMPVNELKPLAHRQELIVKKIRDNIKNNLSNNGDDLDPFTSGRSFNLGTNPAAVPVVTYMHSRSSSDTFVKSPRADDRQIHLSGLGVTFTEQDEGVYRVDISWDNNKVCDTLRWTGDIVNHECVDLQSSAKIILAQNQTPNKHVRDTVTGLFAGPTYFTCLPNSDYIMRPVSRTELIERSSFLLQQDATLVINGSDLTVEEGSSLVLKAGSDLTVAEGGRIEIMPGGHICIEEGANIVLYDSSSKIYIRDGAINGINSDVLDAASYNCRSDLASTPHSGQGKIKMDKNMMKK
jgi:hypothetical protein